MFQSVIVLFISIIPLCLGQPQAVCPNSIGFLDSEDFSSNTPQNSLYFYNGAESIGSSNRFIFPNLTVPCYVNIEKVSYDQSPTSYSSQNISVCRLRCSKVFRLPVLMLELSMS